MYRLHTDYLCFTQDVLSINILDVLQEITTCISHLALSMVTQFKKPLRTFTNYIPLPSIVLRFATFTILNYPQVSLLIK